MDFGISTALQGRRDWGQVRADKLMQLQFVKEKENAFKQRIAQEAQARQGIQEYMDQINSVEVLDQDMEAIKAKEKELRKGVIDGLAKYKGDAFKFQLMGGAGVLNEYKNSLLTSDEMLRAKNNKLAFAQYSLDRYLGRTARPIFEDDGTGNKVRKSMEEIIAEYDRGDRKEIPYEGSVIPKAYQETFSSRYADPNDKTIGKSATRDDVYQDAINQGFEPWQAEDMADKYQNEISSGSATPYNFRYEQPQAMDYNDLISAEKYRRMMAGEDPETGTKTIDIIGDLFASKIDSPSYDKSIPIKFGDSTGEAVEASNLDRNMLVDMLGQEGITKDDKTGNMVIQGDRRDVYFAPKPGSEGAIKKGYITNNDVMYQPESFVKIKVSENGNLVQKTFIKAKVKMEADNGFPGANSKDYGENNRTTRLGDKLRDNEYQATVLIPVEYDMKKYALLNDKYGIKNTQQSTTGASTDMDQYYRNIMGKVGSLGNRSILGDYQQTVSGESQQVLKNTYGSVIDQIRSNPEGYAKMIANTDMSAIVSGAADKYGVSKDELSALFQIESGYDPTAISSAGAMGLGQLMPETAQSLGVKNPFDPKENINASAKYFGDLKKRYQSYNDPLMSIAAYNWGLGNVDTAVKKFGENWVEGSINGYFNDKGQRVVIPQETLGYMNKFATALGY